MLQVGIIGAGRIGRVHIQGIMTGVPGARIRGIAAPHLTEEIQSLARAATSDSNAPAWAITRLPSP